MCAHVYKPRLDNLKRVLLSKYTNKKSAIVINMRGLIQETPYKHITVKELAPTFVAEVQGVDFTKPIESEVFQEIGDALAKVSFIKVLNKQ